MTRAVLALVLGLVLGAAATLWLAPAAQAPQTPEISRLTEPGETPAESTVAPAPAREQARSSFYRELADADAAELAALIRETAARAPSADRTLALGVLFERYAELDAVPAVRLAREVQAGGTALAVVYGAWARAQPDQVLAALSTVASAEDATEVALALIAALGDDAAAVRRVAAVLVARGEVTTFGAVMPAPVIALAPRSALAMTAQRWADLEPRRALTVARELDDERVRRAFETAALRALARAAPDEAFAQLARLDASAAQPQELGAVLVELARTSPERVLSSIRDFPADVRRMAEMAALQQLAERDPLAAARHLEGSAPGPERQMLLQVVARAYGKRDAAAALAWAHENRTTPMLASSVIAGVAEIDPNRALDLALALTSPMGRLQALQVAAMASARDDASAEAMANRLLSIEDRSVRDSVTSMALSMWAQRAPDGAMSWLLAHVEAAPPSAFMQLGQQLAMRDPQNALAYSARVPEPAREQWANGVAMGYAEHDPQAAIAWLGRYRAEPWYGRAAGTLAMSVAQRDGAAAARLFDALDADALGVPPMQLISTIAANWTNQDPAAAAQWAFDRTSGQERDIAVRSVIGMWSSRDVEGARQWTLRMPQGATRDRALTSVLTASAMQRESTLDATLLNAFTSSDARQAAVLQVVQGLAFGDPMKARAIADAHLEPPFREQVDRMIEAARNQPGRAVGLGVAQGTAPSMPGAVAPAIRVR